MNKEYADKCAAETDVICKKLEEDSVKLDEFKRKTDEAIHYVEYWKKCRAKDFQNSSVGFKLLKNKENDDTIQYLDLQAEEQC